MAKTLNRVMTKADWKLIAMEYGRNGVGADDLAKRIGVSRQRIFQVATLLRSSGIDVPSMRGRKGQQREIIKQLKEELEHGKGK